MGLNKIKLSNRLAAIAELVPVCNTIADIGSDHGLLPSYLLSSGRVRYAICTDIKPGPLLIARERLDNIGLSEFADFRIGDGLSVIAAEEAEAVVIAGMGAETIASILDSSLENDTRTYILSPMTKPDRLRLHLSEIGFFIADWRIAFDSGRIYECLAVKKASVCGCEVEKNKLYHYIGRKTQATAKHYEVYINAAQRKVFRELSALTISGSDEIRREHLHTLYSLLISKM